MREILFRGKDVYNNEWVYGFLSVSGDENPSTVIDYPIRDWNVYGQTDVAPETVGQFTGLIDKNGKKIFEGDIVKAERICNGNLWTGCVAWWNGCFAIQGLKDGNNVPAIDLFKDYEVIGNIHDNLELLEGRRWKTSE